MQQPNKHPFDGLKSINVHKDNFVEKILLKGTESLYFPEGL